MNRRSPFFAIVETVFHRHGTRPADGPDKEYCTTSGRLANRARRPPPAEVFNDPIQARNTNFFLQAETRTAFLPRDHNPLIP